MEETFLDISVLQRQQASINTFCNCSRLQIPRLDQQIVQKTSRISLSLVKPLYWLCHQHLRIVRLFQLPTLPFQA
jgi:hypothetical protein